MIFLLGAMAAEVGVGSTPCNLQSVTITMAAWLHETNLYCDNHNGCMKQICDCIATAV